MACAIQDGLAALFQASMGCVPLARTETTETDRIFRVCGHAVRRPGRRLSPVRHLRQGTSGVPAGENHPGKPSEWPIAAPTASVAIPRPLAPSSNCLKARSGVVRGPCNNSRPTLSVAPIANTTLQETTMSTTCPCIAQCLITAPGMASSL